MYCSIEGNRVGLRRDNGVLQRTYRVDSQVIGAYVSGDNVIIQCEDGWVYLYRSDGVMIRRTKG